MYFPYVRGRQYELLSLLDLVNKELLGHCIIPIVEPVSLSPTLVNVIEAFIKASRPIVVIRNPGVGSFEKEMSNAKDEERESRYKKRFLVDFENPQIMKALIMKEGAEGWLKEWKDKKIKKSDLVVINQDRDYLKLYEENFSDEAPRYVLIPDEGIFRRRIHAKRVLLDDKFEKKYRNADYSKAEDEFFSEDHLIYQADNYEGFSDFSIIGNEFIDSGFAPYAVAIHLVYFDKDETLRVHHFVSDSNDDISNPAKKFYEAVSKLFHWYEKNKKSLVIKETEGLKNFLRCYAERSYPGLGTVKKWSLMHHFELMSDYLAGKAH